MRRRLQVSFHPLAKHFQMVTSNKTITETITPSSGQLEAISARSYQTELVAQAKQENLIVCLPTGSGKTYIAVMLIKEMCKSTREKLSKGGKRTIFLVKTVQLVEQQSGYIRDHTDLTVGTYYGEKGVDFWKKDQWDIEFENHQVLVFTAQVFLNLIDHNFFSLNDVNLIIFDECHHATGDNQYAALMSKHYDKCSTPPRVLGLTASISSKKIRPKDLADNAKELEKTYRARIESGSSRSESTQHGTSAHVETIRCASYRDEILNNHESLTIPFDFLRIMINIIQSYLAKQNDEHSKIEAELGNTMLTTDYRGENVTTYHKQSSDYTLFTQSQSITIISLKRFLENLVDVGHELGLAGLYFFAKELRGKLKTSQTRLFIPNRSARELVGDIIQRLDCLVDDILKSLYLSNMSYEILFSPKVIKLVERIVEQQENKGTHSKCIVFVERVYTATMLSHVLSDFILTLKSPWDIRLKVKHVTGIKVIFSDKPMTAKYQRETIKEFRNADLNILIATAVVEEGLDIPQCDLVIRFNKPNNFSSYMQSKGRARAKENASYVLFMDKSDDVSYQRDQKEYENYEEIEKMIQLGFSYDESDGNLDNDLKQIPPYCPSENVTIDATRAAQLIMEYCVLLGNGQIFPPRFLFHGYSSPYTCILSMPANCPIRDDVICKSKKKKLAKYECCLEMVKKLHQEGEFDEHCLPNRHRTALKIPIPIENRIFKFCDQLFEDKSDSYPEIFTKQINTFPVKSDLSSSNWYLYQINNQLGFVVPCQSLKIPKFHIYGPNEIIEVMYLKPIDYQSYQKQLEDFCRYLFEYVFEDMNTETILKFDITNSTFKLLPCLLTKSGEIDSDRMMHICNRKNKFVQDYSELNDNELYWPKGLSRKQLYMNISDPSKLKRASDPWEHDGDKKTYADYFKSKDSDVDIRPDLYLATMKGFKKARINYLKDLSESKKEKSKDVSNEPIYYPIEWLRYAPLNQQDVELIYKLPSILVRISQLYRIEKLRKVFAENKKFLDVDQMPPVTFHDCLKSNFNSSLLPLIPLTYDNLSLNDSDFQPSTDILFQAITRRSTDENVDMENLEILGDCFLKLTVSMSLYHRYPLAGAGALTIEKAKQISNGNLYRIALLKNLKSYLNAVKIDLRGKEANWIPPGYLIQDESELKRYKTQKVKRKAFADMMEAFIGAYLISTNYSMTIQFMKWLGIDVIPENKTIPPIVCSSIGDGEIDSVVNHFYEEQGFSMIEKTIKYQFKNKAYLIAAFTHPSSFANRLTSCYERLEFLGDAVLDFLVTQHIFITKKDITPGRVTDIRQDLSNNGRLAYILVACRFHTKILHNSPDLFGKISIYAGDEDLFPKDSSIEIELNKGIDQWADSTAPKALADVFEALVGAIFLDSGKCLQTVWKVIEPLLQEYLYRSITDPNLNPVRSFFEQGGKVVNEDIITDPKTEKTTSVCMIEATNGYCIIGYGSNRKWAKFDACQKAIKFNLA